MRCLTHGLAAVTLGVVIVSTVMIGGAWAVVWRTGQAARLTRSDLRSAVFVSTPDRLTWPEQRPGIAVELAVLTNPRSEVVELFADRFMGDVPHALAVVFRDAPL